MSPSPPPFLDKVLDLLIDTVFVVDEQGRYVYASASCEGLLGYTPGELIGRNMIELVHPDDRQRTLAVAREIMRGRPQTHFENRYLRKDGRVVDIMWSARWSADEGIRLAVARNVTPLRHAARMQGAVYRVSEAAHVADDLPALYRRIHGIVAELVPADGFEVVRVGAAGDTLTFPYVAGGGAAGGSDRLVDGSPIARVLRTGKPVLTTVRADQEAWPERSPGSEPPATAAREGNWLGVPLLGRSGAVGAIVVRTRGDERYGEEHLELLRFVSTQVAAAIERKQDETRLRYQALHDALTGLPNRTLFLDRLEMALRRARRDREEVGVLYLDVDDFKEVNDGYGHDVGDELLRALAGRLRDCVRESDTVARMGGDEFTVVLPRVRGADGGATVVEKVGLALGAPYRVGSATLTVTVSVGMAVYPQNGADADRLLRHADADMYARKSGTR